MQSQGNTDGRSRNPFETMRPITDLSAGVSRPDDRASAETSIPGRVCVGSSPRQTGKTTFLYELKKNVPGAIYIDFLRKDYRSLEELFSDFQEEVEAVDRTAELPNY